MTISTAITAAGGFRDTAGQSKVVLLRRDPAGAGRAYTIDVARILDGSDLGQNVELGPRDMVFVPRSNLASLNLFIKQLIRRQHAGRIWCRPTPLAAFINEPPTSQKGSCTCLAP